MEIRNVMTFLRVAELLSFTKAAEELGYSQSAVTVQIKQLEDELEIPLFERIGRQVCLTEPGKAFVPYANRICNAVESALSFRMDERSFRGTLRIGSTESVTSALLPSALQKLHEYMPLLEISVRIASSEDLLKMLDKNQVDLVCLMDKKIYADRYIAAVDIPQDICLVAGPGYPLPDRDVLSLDDLDHVMIMTTEKGVSYTAELQSFFAASGKRLNPFLEIGNTDLIIRLVERGCGISFLPRFAVAEKLQSGTLRTKAIADCSLQVHLQLLYNKNKWVTPQMKKMIALAGGTGTGDSHDSESA